MGMVARVQIWDKAAGILHSVNNPGKSMCPTILTLAMGKAKYTLNTLTLVWQPVKEKENWI